MEAMYLLEKYLIFYQNTLHHNLKNSSIQRYAVQAYSEFQQENFSRGIVNSENGKAM
jgi:hypothetical protein